MPTIETVGHRSRGRPRDAEKDAVIRDAAWRILSEKGYEGLTFEGLAESAGCSRATLYRRFASKVELVVAILHETARSLEPELAPDVPPHDALIAHATAAAVYMSGGRGQAVVRLGMTANSPELVGTIITHAENEHEFYRREFRRIAPDASPDDIDFVCQTLIGSVTYHVGLLQQPLSTRRLRQLVDQAIALLHDSPQPDDGEMEAEAQPGGGL
jgi:AcrR family transcriptional regulator